MAIAWPTSGLHPGRGRASAGLCRAQGHLYTWARGPLIDASGDIMCLATFSVRRDQI